MTASALHPRSVAALLASARSHELAADVLRRRNRTASQQHADLAVRLRAKASSAVGDA